MHILTFLQQRKYIIAIAVLVPLALFYLRDDIERVSLDFLAGRERSIGTFLRCADNPLLERPLLAVRKKDTDQIRVLVYFTEKPSVETQEYLATQGVSLFRDTWVLEYAVAELPVSRLCFLAGLPGITGIALGES
jgi:hypothetical protein